MNKAELVEVLTGRLGDRKSAQAALDAVLEEIQRAVSKGDKVSVAGFGVFEKRARAARMARNPRTGEAVKVKKTTVPAFRPGQGFKDLVSGVTKPAPAPKTAAAKKTASKSAAKSTAKAAAAKKTTTKKAAAKKTAAKKTTAPATKAATRKTATRATKATGAAKKTVKAAAKSTTKKATTTKAVAKKTAKKAAKKK